MKRRVFSLVSLAIIATLLLTACQIQRWEVVSPESLRHTVVEEHSGLGPVHFYIPKYLSEGPSQTERLLLPPPHMLIDALKSKIEVQNGVRLFEVIESASDTGIFCSLRLEELEMSAWRRTWDILSFETASLIPFYDDSLEYTVTYEVFADAKLKARYRYTVHGKQLEWIAVALVLPFVPSDWQIVNIKYGSVSEGLLDGLLSTSRLFVEDARRDGFLR